MLRGLVQWERYWVPLGVKIATEAAGFLCDPKGFGQPNKKSFRVLSELWDLPFVVLCGEPASGKSTLVEIQTELFSKGPEKFRQLLMIDFRTILDAAGFREQLDRSQIWRDWRSAQYPLHIVIDGVDEGLFKLGTFSPRSYFIVSYNLLSAFSISPARSPMRTQGAIVLPLVTRGIIEASAIRSR